MKKGVMVGLIVGVVLVLLIIGFFALTNNKNPSNKNTGSQNEAGNSNQMVDCGMMENPSCFANRMNECLPVTGKMIGSDDTTNIEMTILGVENETCHFQRKINNVIDLNCYFPKGTMNWDTIDQTFGNDKGLQKVVDDACKSGW
jgi:hypothetical protein